MRGGRHNKYEASRSFVHPRFQFNDIDDRTKFLIFRSQRFGVEIQVLSVLFTA